MIDNQILQQKKDCCIIDLENSLSQNEIKQLFQNKSLSTKIHVNSKLDDTKTYFMGDLLKQSQELTFLEISCDLLNLTTPKPLFHIGECFSSFQKLNYLIINFNVTHNQTNTNLITKSIGQGITHLQNLMIFKFRIDRIEQLGIESAKEICEGIQNLNQLTDIQLILGFGSQEQENNQMKVLKELCGGSVIQNCLKQLCLEFNFESNIQDTDIEELSTISKYFVNLNKMEVKINKQSNITNQCIMYLKKCTLNLQNLQIFKISISEKIQFSFIDDFIENLFELENLEDINVSVQIELSTMEQYKLGKGIKQNTKLKNLSLSVINPTLRYTSSTQLSLERNILNLTNLIEFAFIMNDLNSESFEIFLSLLKGNSNIRALSIHFFTKQKTENIELLKQQISKLKNLQILNLAIKADINISKQLLNYFKRKNLQLLIFKKFY